MLFFVLQGHLSDGVITANAKLAELDLSDNAFGPDGVKACVKLLTSQACYSLKTLRLNNNGLGVGGGKVRDLFLMPFGVVFFGDTVKTCV